MTPSLPPNLRSPHPSDFFIRAQTDWKRQRAWLPNWKPTKGELERKLGLKNSIRKEKKEISSLEASLEMYEKSLAHLEEVNAKYEIVKQGKKMAKGKPFDSKVPSQWATNQSP